MDRKHPYYNKSMWKGAPSSSFTKAKHLRENMTAPEKMLWEKLKGNQLLGYKFRRQHPMQLYILDFYCHKLQLVIELDGEYHNNKQQQKLDIERERALKELGLKIIRFSNEEVLQNLDDVIEKITSVIVSLENKL